MATEKKTWEVVEIILKGTAGVIISKLDLDIPRFSFRVGTAKFLEEGEPPHIIPWLNVHNVLDAAELLAEAEDKYVKIRQVKIRETRVKQQGQQEQDGPLITYSKGD